MPGTFHRFGINRALQSGVLILIVAGCAPKEKDPLDDIKALIPRIEERLNKRDLEGLKEMGTKEFESNALVIDVFGEHTNDSVSLSLDRISHSPVDAILVLKMAERGVRQRTSDLHLGLTKNGRWMIRRYSIIGPGVDITRP